MAIANKSRRNASGVCFRTIGFPPCLLLAARVDVILCGIRVWTNDDDILLRSRLCVSVSMGRKCDGKRVSRVWYVCLYKTRKGCKIRNETPRRRHEHARWLSRQFFLRRCVLKGPGEGEPLFPITPSRRWAERTEKKLWSLKGHVYFTCNKNINTVCSPCSPSSPYPCRFPIDFSIFANLTNTCTLLRTTTYAWEAEGNVRLSRTVVPDMGPPLVYIHECWKTKKTNLFSNQKIHIMINNIYTYLWCIYWRTVSDGFEQHSFAHNTCTPETCLGTIDDTIYDCCRRRFMKNNGHQQCTLGSTREYPCTVHRYFVPFISKLLSNWRS